MGRAVCGIYRWKFSFFMLLLFSVKYTCSQLSVIWKFESNVWKHVKTKPNGADPLVKPSDNLDNSRNSRRMMIVVFLLIDMSNGAFGCNIGWLVSMFTVYAYVSRDTYSKLNHFSLFFFRAEIHFQSCM